MRFRNISECKLMCPSHHIILTSPSAKLIPITIPSLCLGSGSTVAKATRSPVLRVIYLWSSQILISDKLRLHYLDNLHYLHIERETMKTFSFFLLSSPRLSQYPQEAIDLLPRLCPVLRYTYLRSQRIQPTNYRSKPLSTF